MARGIAKGDRVGIWAPNRVEWVLPQYATATIGAILVNINPAYKTAELEYALRQSGVSVLLAARAFRTSDYAGDARGGARPLPGAARGGRARRPAGSRSSRTPRRVTEEELARARGDARARRPDQHPVHLGHHRLPQGRDAHPPQHPQQRLLHRRGAAATPRRTASASRCRSTTASGWSSATWPAPPTARAWSSPARPSTRWPRWRRCRPSAAPRSTACRPCSSPMLEHPRFGEFDLRHPAHRHHGRLALPGRGDEAGPDPAAHAGGHHLLRHDRDLAGLDPDRAWTTRSTSASAPSAASTRTSR